MMRMTAVAALAGLLVAGGSDAAATRRPVKTAMLPDRVLRCVLGRATNLDPSKAQTRGDIKYEGRHSFVLSLPAIPVRQGPPPDPTDDPEPVDARTRILSDPDGLAAVGNKPFDRVVDLWPERVEMVTKIDPPLINLIIVSSIDLERRTASLFMTRAQDAASMDLSRVYQGNCSVSIQRAG